MIAFDSTLVYIHNSRQERKCHMQKKIIQWSLLGSVLFILLSFNVDGLLLRFMVIGEVPGSNNTLSPMTMLSIYAASIALTVLYIFIPRSQIDEFGKRAQSIKSRLPRKRFSSL